MRKKNRNNKIILNSIKISLAIWVDPSLCELVLISSNILYLHVIILRGLLIFFFILSLKCKKYFPSNLEKFHSIGKSVPRFPVN